MTVLHIFTGVLLPILVLIGTGWLLQRRLRLDLGTLVRLNLALFVPGFIFYEVVNSQLRTTLALQVVGFTGCVIAAMALVSSIVGRVSGFTRPQIRSMQLATMFYNSGNYGVPLMTLAYPGLGALLQVFIVLTQNISTFTVGLLIASTGQQSGWRTFLPVLRQPSLWAAVAALLVRTAGIPVQEWRWIWVPVQYVHAGLVGVALVTLGAQLALIARPPSGFRLGWALAIRLAGGPIVAAALVPLFGFQGETAEIMIVSASFPTAVNTALIAHEFNADPEFAAAAVLGSTLASAVTVTVLIAVLRVW